MPYTEKKDSPCRSCKYCSFCDSSCDELLTFLEEEYYEEHPNEDRE